MVDHFTELLPGQVAIRMHGIPVFLVHVVTGLYLRVTLTQLNSPFGVAFNIELSPN